MPSRIAVAGQDFFADAPVLCILAPRFPSQLLEVPQPRQGLPGLRARRRPLVAEHCSCATEAGLGPFVTGAISEVDLERAFGMDPCVQSPIAVCGFGARAATLRESEFDPNRKVWPRG